MQAIFFIIYLFAALYQILARRRIDVFSVAVAGCCAYFVPGLFGWVVDPNEFANDSWRLRTMPLDPLWYGVAAIVLGSVLLTEMIYDQKDAMGVRRGCRKSAMQVGLLCGTACSVAGWLTFVALVFDVTTAGSALWSLDKSEVLAAASGWTILRNSSCCVAAVLLIGGRNRLILAAVVVTLFVDVFSGHRSTAAMLVTSCILFSSRAAIRTRLIIEKPRVVGAIFLFAAVVICYKAIYVFIKAGDLSAIAELVGGGRFLNVAVFSSEPFVTQAILNDTLRYGLSVPPSQILIQVLQNFMLFAPNLGLETQGFGETAASVFYPSVEWGVASNIWAQMIAAGGTAGLLVFLVVFNTVLLLLASMIRRGGEVVSRGAAIVASYWAFFIHRNDVGYILNIEKRRLLCLGLCLFIAVLVHWRSFLRRGKMLSTEGGML